MDGDRYVRAGMIDGRNGTRPQDDIRLSGEESARQLEAMKESLAAMRLKFDAMYELKKKKPNESEQVLRERESGMSP